MPGTGNQSWLRRSYPKRQQGFHHFMKVKSNVMPKTNAITKF